MQKKYLAKIKSLSSLAYDVTQNNATEKAFENLYWHHQEPGIYIDIISGEALFCSLDKFDAGCGWPSFAKTINEANIILKEDLSHGLKRTEVASNTSHLGHLFRDGPKELTGLRYCINSAALQFIPQDELVKSGYGEYLRLFSKETTPSWQYCYLAGGCFWGLEHLLACANGVISARVGYCGGELPNPTYQQVSSGNTNYAETVEVKFDPDKTTYRHLLKLFFTMHDPTTSNSQGNDYGSQYRSEIFYNSESQKYAALNIIELANSSGVFSKPIVTMVSPLKNFYAAEKYHQQYLAHNPHGYSCHYVRNHWAF
jgi:peptide methionine sulfoxide reductase msrA/msrB